jgi:hypothetical protein
MLFVEVFFPLTKSVWKEHSTYQSDEDSALEDDLARIRANRVSLYHVECSDTLTNLPSLPD